MISVNLAYNGYVGLSTDTKPIEDVNNGSCFFEMDTQKKYMFNAEGAEWIEQTAEGGGGGGSTGGSVVYTAEIDTQAQILGAYFNATDSAAIIADFLDGKSVLLELPGSETYGVYHCMLLVTSVIDKSPANITYGIADGATAGNYTLSGNLRTEDDETYFVGIYME